jgi:hypothetical protein
MRYSQKSRMKKLLPLFLIAMMLGCSDNDDPKYGQVELVLKLQFDDQPLVMFDRYDYDQDLSIFYTRFSFFVSRIDISPDPGQGSLVDVAYFNLTDAHSDIESSNAGFKFLIDSVKVGSYSGLSFNIGVPADMNSQRPSDFPAGHPLSDIAEYWEAWNSFIFLKTEGRMDTDQDGEHELSFALHIGSDSAFRQISLSKAIDVAENQTSTCEIFIDLKDVFLLPGNEYDIQAQPQIHRLDQLPAGLKLLDNLVVIME